MKIRTSTALSSAMFALLLIAPIPDDAQQYQYQAQPHLTTCALKAPLKLDQVVGQVTNKVADDRIEELVSVCHVDFSLDPPALERLSAAGASPSLIDVLSGDTISRMTAAQAHGEVAALERRMRENEAAFSAQRDAALAKLDADFQASPEKAPKDQFRSPASARRRGRQCRWY